MRSRIADHLRAARRRQFVGRSEAVEHFTELVQANEPEYFALHIFGPGGVGKTSLLHEFEHRARAAGCTTAYIDGRNIEAAPDSLLAAVRDGLGFDATGTAPDEPTPDGRFVILLDTVERLRPLEDWLREEFLPQLSDAAVVVMAGRDELGPDWRADPGWQSLLHTLPLRNLSHAESVECLTRRSVPADQREAIARFTHGYPLALSLVADMYDQQPDYRFRPDTAVDLVAMLASQLLDEVTDPRQRAALDICGLVRGTTEAILAELLETPDVHDIFRWLSRLSFIDAGPRGLFPHDMARAVLHSDLRWRNPERYGELHRRARAYYIRRFQETQGQAQQRILLDLIYLHRDSPVIKPYFEWEASAGGLPERLQPDDLPDVLAMVARHEGEQSAALADFWVARQPERAFVLRDSDGRSGAFLMLVSLEQVTSADLARDPAVRATHDYLLHHAPLRTGERATLFRFWMAAENYQFVSPHQTRLFTLMVRHYLTTPQLAFTFLPCADPAFWQPGFDYANLVRLPEADYTIGGQHYGVFGHDWRRTPPIQWLALMGEREMGGEIQPPAAPEIPTLLVLSEESFTRAVRQALQQLWQPELLAENPLLRSRVVADGVAPEADTETRATYLRQLVLAASAALQATPRDLKLYRALQVTYLEPQPTQEAAAEALDLPFSTYRRHLREGVQRIVHKLWALELGGVANSAVDG